MTLYEQRICLARARLQMTGAHNFIRLYALVICDHAPAQRNVEDFDFVSAVPHSNHNTVGTASWQNHDSSSPQSVIILHCHVCLCLSNPNISSALWRQCKSKKYSTFTRLWMQRFFFDERIQIPLYKRAIIGSPVKRHY